MNRHALLIGCPGGNLPGVRHDISNMSAFLQADHGGVWYPAEIKTSLAENRSAIADRVNAIPHCDFVLLFFSGHGGIETQSGGTEEFILFFEKETHGTLKEIYDTIKSKTRKALIIIDACRSFIPAEELRGDSYVESALKSYGRDRNQIRSLFDSAITRADFGISIVYSCGRGETSMDSEAGGVFTRSLIANARNRTSALSATSFLPINLAVNGATTYMNANFLTAQNPCMAPEKRINQFPFAIGTR